MTDHRTDLSVGDTQGVLDGKIDPFINAYMHQQMGIEIAGVIAAPGTRS